MNTEGLKQAHEVCERISRLDYWTEVFAYRLMNYNGTKADDYHLTHAQLQCLACIDELKEMTLTAKFFYYELNDLIEGDGE